jgi:hypothetical protein
MATFSKSFKSLVKQIDNANIGKIPSTPPPILKGFLDDMSSLGKSADDFRIVKKNDIFVLTVKSESGEQIVINTKKVLNLMENGKIDNVLTNLQVSLKNSNVQKFRETFMSNYKQLKWVGDFEAQKTAKQIGENVQQKIGKQAPETLDQVTTILKEHKNLSQSMQTGLVSLKNKLKNEIKSVKIGTWVKTTVIVSGAVVGMSFMIQKIIEHKKEMNGCWLIRTEDDFRCKINALSCPIEITSNTNNCTPLYQCGRQKTAACFEKDTCIDENCTQKIGNVACTEPKDEPCSKFCSANKIDCPAGYVLKCVNVNFWGAAVDFIGITFSEFFSDFWFYFKILFVIVLVIIFFQIVK